MKSMRTTKFLAVVFLIILIGGWVLTIWGVPGTNVKPLKDKLQLGLDIKGGVYVVLEAQNTGKYSDQKLTELMDQTKTVIENRVDQLGLSNPNVAVEGKNRIRVELPGATDANEAIEQIGKTAQLKFTMADQGFVLDGSAVKDANSGTSHEGKGYVVNLEFNRNGAKAFEDATKKALSGTVKPTVTSDMCQDKGKVEGNQILIWLDNEVISHPGVNEVISGGKCEISGSFTQKEAANLAALIRGGSLPLELKEIQSSSQTAQIGMDAFEMSVIAGIIGLALIFIIMLIAYRVMGVAADICLALFIVFIIAGMAIMGSVLTLPGIAGIILSIGMAVDANVVIFTRIREEISNGKSPRVAAQAGYKRALSTVIDSQVTTLIAAVVLYQIGTSSVKGFAWTLMIGTIGSIVTGVLISQIFLKLIATSKTFGTNKMFGMRPDGTASFQLRKTFRFVEHRKIWYCISATAIVIGIIFFSVRGFNYGIDFTGGTMLEFDTGHKVATKQVEDVMKRHDVNIKQMQVVYSGDKQEQLIVKTNESLNKNERQAIIGDMTKTFRLSKGAVLASEHFQASVGKELKKNALKAILLAALGMLIYIRLRFRQWKFGAAALLGVLHDVLIMISFYAVFGITVNNPFIAAILTVVGYSINDTIVIFDRVRENLRTLRRGNIIEMLDRSINQTLSRSLMTSFTTLVVMLPLYIMASSAIREFVVPLMVGVAAGTLSSIFVCSPLYYEMSKRDHHSKYQRQQLRAKKKKEKELQDADDPYAEKRREKNLAREEKELLAKEREEKERRDLEVKSGSDQQIHGKGQKKKSRKERKSEE